MATIEGIDISNAQLLTINFAAAFASGIRFVYAKATEGTGYVDPKFAKHVANAKAAGMLTGAYHYLRVRHGSLQDASKQADGFCDAYLAAGCDLLPMLDCEITGNKDATVVEWLAAIRMWVDRVKVRLGCDPILYTYPSFWMELGHDAAIAQDLGELRLWIAHYTPKPEPIVPAPWKTWTMWQYAADAGVIGAVDGVPGHVDRDRLKGVLTDITRAVETPKLPVPPSPVTPENPVPLPQPKPQPLPVPIPVPTPAPSVGFAQWLLQAILSIFRSKKP